MSVPRIARAWTVVCVAALGLAVSPTFAAVPSSGAPKRLEVAADLMVVEAELGYVDPKTQAIVPARRIDTSRHSGFGWRVKLEGRRRTVRFREEFILPAPAQTWEVGPRTIVAPDRASAVTEGSTRLDGTMELGNGWIHTPGDPKGAHVMRVWVNGVLVQEFDFVLY